MKILIINGANLNLLGRRQPEIYGNKSFEEYLEALRARYSEHSLDYFQSNIEGELVNQLQAADGKYDGVVLNAGALQYVTERIRGFCMARGASFAQVCADDDIMDIFFGKLIDLGVLK